MPRTVPSIRRPRAPSGIATPSTSGSSVIARAVPPSKTCVGCPPPPRETDPDCVSTCFSPIAGSNPGRTGRRVRKGSSSPSVAIVSRASRAPAAAAVAGRQTRRVLRISPKPLLQPRERRRVVGQQQDRGLPRRLESAHLTGDALVILAHGVDEPVAVQLDGVLPSPGLEAQVDTVLAAQPLQPVGQAVVEPLLGVGRVQGIETRVAQEEPRRCAGPGRPGWCPVRSPRRSRPVAARRCRSASARSRPSGARAGPGGANGHPARGGRRRPWPHRPSRSRGGPAARAMPRIRPSCSAVKDPGSNEEQPLHAGSGQLPDVRQVSVRQVGPCQATGERATQHSGGPAPARTGCARSAASAAPGSSRRYRSAAFLRPAGRSRGWAPRTVRAGRTRRRPGARHRGVPALQRSRVAPPRYGTRMCWIRCSSR